MGISNDFIIFTHMVIVSKKVVKQKLYTQVCCCDVRLWHLSHALNMMRQSMSDTLVF